MSSSRFRPTGTARWFWCPIPMTPSTVSPPQSPSGQRAARPCATRWRAAAKSASQGMAPEEAGPLREDEQRRSAAIVGVDHVEFWDFPDSNIRNTPELRAKIAETSPSWRPTW